MGNQRLSGRSGADAFTELDALTKRLGSEKPTSLQALELQKALEKVKVYEQDLKSIGIDDISSFRSAPPEDRAKMIQQAMAKKKAEDDFRLLANVQRNIGY